MTRREQITFWTRIEHKARLRVAKAWAWMDHDPDNWAAFEQFHRSVMTLRWAQRKLDELVIFGRPVTTMGKA